MALMNKFTIACPRCGKYVEAKQFLGIFGSRRLTCSCGYVIDVKAEKLSSRKCEKCGNVVVFDQSKGEKATCPVCGEPINTPTLRQQNVEVACEQCGLTLNVEKSSQTAVCPLCGHANDMTVALARAKAKASNLPAVLKFEGAQDVLVWKHPIEDFLYGSQLIVHESQEAIFFRDGQALDSFGPGRHTLETQRLPLVGRVAAPNVTQGEMFHAEVYFVNLATVLGLKWGTDSKVRLFDPISGLHVELGASGEFNVHVTDARELLLKVIGTGRDLRTEELLGNIGNGKTFFRALVMAQVKSGLARCIRESAINILEIDEHLTDLSETLRVDINRELNKFGLEMSEFVVSRVLLPEDDPNYQRLRQQHADLYLKVRDEQIRKREAEAKAERMFVEAEAKARIRAIEAGGEAEAFRRMAAAEAEKMRMQGYTYQQETQRQVGLEAMKHGLAGGAEGGGGGASAIGEIASLGMALGMMGPVAQAAQQAIAPISTSLPGGPAQPPPAGWDCPKCGAKVQTGRFCAECGAARPAPATWDCACGKTRLTSKFCPECGAERPAPATWDCACGKKGLTEKFCPECGAKRP